MNIDDLRTDLFVGHDLNLNVTLQFSGGELQGLLDQLTPLLRHEALQIQEGRFVAPGAEVTLNAAQIEALSHYLVEAGRADGTRRQEAYLIHLCLSNELARWSTRYVTLSGWYRIDPSFSEIRVQGEGAERRIERIALPDVRDALQRHERMILLGLPGAGKSTVLQRLAFDQARQRLHDASARLPLLVSLADQLPHEAPHSFLARSWAQRLAARPEDAHADFAAALQAGCLCLLCDGVNEISRDGPTDQLRRWQRFAGQLPAGNQIVFACRKDDYAGELAVAQVEIDPLSDEQVQDFAWRTLNDQQAGADFWLALTGPHATLLPLARIPFYLHLLVEEYAARRALPDHRARLFDNVVQRVFDREHLRQPPALWIAAAAQRFALSELAYAMQAEGEGTVVPLEEARSLLPSQVDLGLDGLIDTPADQVLRLGRDATLLAVRSDHATRFIHQLFQEYFASLALLRRWREGDDLADRWRVPSRRAEMPPAPRGRWDPLPGPPTSRWEQTTILAAGLDPALVAALRMLNPALAAACMLELPGEIDELERDACCSDLLARLNSPAIHLRSRIQAGLLLGRLGNPRFTVETVNGVRLILPPMVEILAARATIGAGWWQPNAHRDERPRHTIDLAAYALGRYPVTNAEYRCFIEADGYEDERWWPTPQSRAWRAGEPVPGEVDPTEARLAFWRRLRANPTEIEDLLRSGLFTELDAENWRDFITDPEEEALRVFRGWYPSGQPLRQPRFWHDGDFNNPSQPLVGVCWYEACAYAAWLAHSSGLALRLPSEAEWEWAARRGARSWPWGWRWDSERLNSLEGRVMRTTPVGAYPHGATAGLSGKASGNGLCDLAGNVLEWTSSRYLPYPVRQGDGRDDLAATGLRIVRGGAWTEDRRTVRCGFRNRDDPRGGDNDLGYRLARTVSR